MLVAIGLLVVVVALAYGAVALLANGMSSAPMAKGVAYWPFWAGLLGAALLFAGAYYGW